MRAYATLAAVFVASSILAIGVSGLRTMPDNNQLLVYSGTGSPPVTSSGSSYTIQEPVPPAQGNIYFIPGRVMTRGIDVYGIFYGDFVNGTNTIISTFVNHLGSSDIWKVVQTYYGITGRINDQIKWAGEYHDNYSQGKNLTTRGNHVDKIIANALRVNHWTPSYKAIYVVFVAKDVSEEYFGKELCGGVCGYHTLSTTLGLKKAVVVDGTKCRYRCINRYWSRELDITYSINRNQAADSIISILFHEIAETASDFNGKTWRDAEFEENADKCSWLFLEIQGATLISGNGTNGGQVYQSPFDNAYNVDFGAGGKYLIQSMWSANKQQCLLSQ